MKRTLPSPRAHPISFNPGALACLLASLAVGPLGACSLPPSGSQRSFEAPGSSPFGTENRTSSSFSGFPDGSTDRSVWVEARFVTTDSTALGANLTGLDVLPVALRLGHLDAEWEHTRLSRDTFDAHLYLQDGTVLGWVGPRASGRAEAVQRAELLHGLDYSILPAWGDSKEGYVFFGLKSGVTIQGERAVVRDAAGVRQVPLEGSLLAFRIETATGSREVRVGVRGSGR